MAKRKDEETPDAPAQTPYEAGEWVDTTGDPAGSEHPPIGTLVWFSTDGEPPVHLGKFDGEQYFGELTGRQFTVTEVTGYKQLMSVAPDSPGFIRQDPPAEPDPDSAEAEVVAT